MSAVASQLAYDTPKGYRGLDSLLTKELEIDQAKASATGIFASASRDRGGDLMTIEGIDTVNHKKNPLVLWLHGFDWSSDGQKPIGQTESPEGEYTVKLLPKEGIAIATTFFSQVTLLAAQVTAMVMEKTVRGQSIGYREKSVERMIEDDRYVGTKILESELIEISWVPVPMNQDAVRSAVSRPWCGKDLHPSIKTALSPYLPPAPVWANGFTAKSEFVDSGGASVAEEEPSEKAKRAKAAHFMVDKKIQRYAEEHNEPKFAKAVGGESEPDNLPYDIRIDEKGKPKHGVELKTMVDNKNNKITMKGSAQDKKADWEVANKATFHTVIYDDQAVFNAKGDGKHDESKRVIYYRRGGGSFRVESMHPVKDHAELKKLMNAKENDLPEAARPTSNWKARQAAAKERAGK